MLVYQCMRTYAYFSNRTINVHSTYSAHVYRRPLKICYAKWLGECCLAKAISILTCTLTADLTVCGATVQDVYACPRTCCNDHASRWNKTTHARRRRHQRRPSVCSSANAVKMRSHGAENFVASEWCWVNRTSTSSKLSTRFCFRIPHRYSLFVFDGHKWTRDETERKTL